jgi:hypothetical protein
MALFVWPPGKMMLYLDINKKHIWKIMEDVLKH